LPAKCLRRTPLSRPRLAEERFLLDPEKENQVELDALAFVRGQDPNGGCISKPADRFDGSTPALDLLVEPLEC
jgi:hypothetical protein